MITPYRRQTIGRAKPRGEPFAVNRFGEGQGPEPGNTVRALGGAAPDPMLIDDKLSVEWYANGGLENASYVVTTATEALASVLGKLATQCQANATIDLAVVVFPHIDLTGSPTHFLQNARQIYTPNLPLGNTIIVDGTVLADPVLNGTLAHLDWNAAGSPVTVNDNANGDTARADMLEQLCVQARLEASIQTAVVSGTDIHLTAVSTVHIDTGVITADLPSGGNTVIATGGHLPAEIHNGGQCVA